MTTQTLSDVKRRAIFAEEIAVLATQTEHGIDIEAYASEALALANAVAWITEYIDEVDDEDTRRAIREAIAAGQHAEALRMWREHQWERHDAQEDIVIQTVPVRRVPSFDDDAIQFPRLLAELNACGLTDEQYAFLHDSADLTPEQVDGLLERAEQRFERLKDELLKT